MTKRNELRRAGQIAKDIRERQLTAYIKSLFFDAVHARHDWEMDGERCWVAEYADGSILVYYPDRVDTPARVLQSHAQQQAARDFLRGEHEHSRSSIAGFSVGGEG